MPWPARIVMIRHGESQGNVLTADERAASPVATHACTLTPRGRWQAEVTRDWIADQRMSFDEVLSSYYARTLETAGILFPSRRVRVDSRLQEAQRGVYHHMTKPQVEAAFPGELARMEKEGLYHYRPIGGENWPDMEIRIWSFLETLRSEYAGKEVAIVVHGNWLVVLEKIIQEWSIEKALVEYRQTNNCGVTIHDPYCSSDRIGDLTTTQYNKAPWQGMEEPVWASPTQRSP